MALFKLLLKGFEFPAALPGKHSNFRFVFELRHFDSSAETWVTTESVSPGLSTYWECDVSKASGGARLVVEGPTGRVRRSGSWWQRLFAG